MIKLMIFARVVLISECLYPVFSAYLLSFARAVTEIDAAAMVCVVDESITIRLPTREREWKDLIKDWMSAGFAVFFVLHLKNRTEGDHTQ